MHTRITKNTVFLNKEFPKQTGVWISIQKIELGRFIWDKGYMDA
jgi:hypothetical protein